MPVLCTSSMPPQRHQRSAELPRDSDRPSEQRSQLSDSTERQLVAQLTRRCAAYVSVGSAHLLPAAATPPIWSCGSGKNASWVPCPTPSPQWRGVLLFRVIGTERSPY